MSRNRHKSRSKAQRPELQPPAIKLSPSAQIVANRIASVGVEYLRQNLIHVMTDSTHLAYEPEFIDLNLDPQRTTSVSQRWLTTYKKRLADAKKKGEEAYLEVSDEMQIEILNELTTPAFRKDVIYRLQSMLDRVMITDDLEKIELLLLLRPMLEMKEIPWGLCGLIQAIYERTTRQLLQGYEEEKNVFDEVVKELKEADGEQVDVLKLLESPEKLEQIGEKIFSSKPELHARMEKQMTDMLDTFEKELIEGKINLNIFTEEELLLPFLRLQEEFGKPILEVQPSDEVRSKVLDAIVKGIGEIMTPERYQRLRQKLQNTAQIWLREGKEWAVALQGELISLDENEYEKNSFVLSTFIGQVSRKGKSQKSVPKKKKRK